MSAPPATFKDARHHRADHTDDGQQANHWEKPAEDDVGDDDPVERAALESRNVYGIVSVPYSMFTDTS